MLFVVAPVAVALFGFERTWLPLAVAVLLSWLPIPVLFFRAHRAVHPNCGAERISRLSMLLLLPPAAIRACDAIWRDALCTFHPLAVARCVLPSDEFRELAQRVIADFRAPIEPVSPPDAPGDAQQTEAWFRGEVFAAVDRFVRKCGLDTAELLAPPTPEDERCLAYCPRCRGQFVMPGGSCHACGGVPTRPIESIIVDAARGARPTP